jgi:predicted metalloprotease with PDZ domain
VHVVSDGHTVEAKVTDDDGVTLVETDDDAHVAEGAAITDADGDLVGLCTWEDHQLRALDLSGTPALMAAPAPGERGWLGIVGRDDDGAVVVMRVEATSPARTAGVLVGDVIMEVDGTSIASFADLRDEVAARSPGTDVTLTVLRGSSFRILTVTLAQEPAPPTTVGSSPTTTAATTTTTTTSSTLATP